MRLSTRCAVPPTHPPHLCITLMRRRRLSVPQAATMGHFDIVWFLAEKGADLKAPHKDHAGGGHNALILSAVRHRSVEALQKLKDLGVDLDTRHWNGNSALHEAARSGEKELVAWLIRSGANVSATNDSGEGPVAEAASMGHFDVLWLLLEAGCEVGEPGSSTLNNLVMSAVRHSNTALLDHLQARAWYRVVACVVCAWHVHGVCVVCALCVLAPLHHGPARPPADLPPADPAIPRPTECRRTY